MLQLLIDACEAGCLSRPGSLDEAASMAGGIRALGGATGEQVVYRTTTQRLPRYEAPLDSANRAESEELTLHVAN